MGLTADCDGVFFPLASNSGWSDFGKWADALDATQFIQVVRLWEHGFVMDVAALAMQLNGALSAHPPQDPTVIETAKNLLSITLQQKGCEYLAVTDGTNEDEGGEDECDEEAADFDPE